MYRRPYTQLHSAGSKPFVDLTGPVPQRDEGQLPMQKETLYIFVTRNQELRLELVRMGAGAICVANGQKEILTWLLSACRAVYRFGDPKDTNYDFEYVPVDNLTQIDEFVTAHGEYFFTPTLQLTCLSLTEMHVYLAYAGILIGKNINAQFYHLWMMRRLQAFFGLLHIRNVEEKPTVPFETAELLHFEFDRSLCIRRIVFFTLTYGAELQHSVSDVYILALDLLRFTKMTGMSLIFTFLMNDELFPILYLDRWAPDRHNLVRALEIWLAHPDYEQPYLRILYNDVDMRPLGGPRLERLVYASLLIGQRYFPTLANLNMRIAADRDMIRRDVEFWLNRRSSGLYWPERPIPSVPGIFSMPKEVQNACARIFRSEDTDPPVLAIAGPSENREEENENPEERV